MTDGHVPSSPHFFRPVVRAMLAWIALLLAGAALVPAPLERAADPAHAPNPAKAAWFLVWVQELVSHGTAWMYPVVALVVAFVAFPWLRRTRIEHAEWFRRGERLMGAIVAGLVLAILVLTVVGYFLRGEQWLLRWPG